MATTATTQWILELVDKITGPMKAVVDSANKAADGVEGVGKKSDETGEKLGKMSAMDLYAVSNSVQQLTDDFNKIMAPGIAFESKMKDIEAITGVSGKALDQLGDKARDTAKKFGGDAPAMLESYKGILSRLGPDIAKDQDALKLMGENVATLSKTMGNDAVGAMDALTTSMLQMGVDLNNPRKAAEEMSKMMNVMAAGAKWGASEVDQISEALKQAGVQMKSSNVGFEEGNAALQALAQGGKYGSEAGVALRNVLGKMAGLDVIPKDAQEKIKGLGINFDIVSNKSLPLTTRLKELSKAQADSTLIAQIFGTENAAAASILMQSIPLQEDLTKKITGTNTATEQANVVMGSYSEWLNRTKSWINDLGISVFNVAGGMLPFVNGIGMSVVALANMANARSGIIMLLSSLKTMPVVGSIVSGGFAMMSTAAKMLGAAIGSIPIVGWIAVAISGLIALGAYFYQTSATFRGILMGVWEFIKTAFTGYYKFIWEVMQAIWHVIRGVFDPRTWFDKSYKFSDAFDKVINAAKEYGENLGKSFAEGRKKGEESYKSDHQNDKKTTNKSSVDIKSISPKITPSAFVSGGGSSGLKQKEMNSANSGGIKNITQKIEIKNYFTVGNGTDVDAIAEKVVRAINGRLSDSLAAI